VYTVLVPGTVATVLVVVTGTKIVEVVIEVTVDVEVLVTVVL
jgi:hypothetical protein